jgi:sporulation protein YlmC with PRC-barrel domain
MRRWKQTSGLPVASLAEGALVAKLEDVLFELETGRVWGWRVKAGTIWGKSGGVAAAHLTRLGKDLAFVTEAAAIEWAGAPTGEQAGRVWASVYLGTRVMTRRGASVGEVADLSLAVDPPAVRGLVLGDGRVVRWDERVTVGPDAVILDDPSVAVEE